MIDTITLLIPQEKFEIMNYDAFNPSAKGIFEPPFYKLSKGSMKCVQNPSKSEIKNGVYKPKLTLSKKLMTDGYKIGLKIEFSIPKLLYGNNFSEVETYDFEKIVYRLHDILQEMQVNVSIADLCYAKVVGVHYSKNFLLARASSSLVISAIRKLNISKRLDNSNTDYKNDGQSIRFHANSYELTFYDKCKDLEQSRISDKRAVESDNSIQSDLLSSKLVNKEVLRMEVRLNSTSKIEHMIYKCNLDVEYLMFYEMCNKDVSSTILNYFWDNYIEKSLSGLLLAEPTASEIFHKISTNCSPKVALQLYGAIKIIENEGYRTLKMLVPAHTYLRITKELENIDFEENYLYNVFKDIKSDLNSMKSLKLEDI